MSAASSAPLRSVAYRGRVMHQRLRPLRHRLDYGMFTLLIDIDELPALHERLRWFSVGRFNLFSFRPSDHGDGAARDGSGCARRSTRVWHRRDSRPEARSGC